MNQPHLHGLDRAVCAARRSSPHVGRLAATIGGSDAPGCGWAADILGLADLLGTVRS